MEPQRPLVVVVLAVIAATIASLFVVARPTDDGRADPTSPPVGVDSMTSPAGAQNPAEGAAIATPPISSTVVSPPTRNQRSTTPTSDLAGTPTTPLAATDGGPGTLQDEDPLDRALRIAEILSEDIVLPSDCELPLDEPASLPNADRAYRSGTHRGIDFICGEPGRTAVAALPGRVVFVRGDYVEPTVADRNALLEQAAELGYTPPWTLAMLYGNFVVLDHGSIKGIGHVTTIYVHLIEVHSTIRTGVTVSTGQPLGVIGNTGTAAAASDTHRPRSYHLHWEMSVGVNGFYGERLTDSETSVAITRLFEAELK